VKRTYEGEVECEVHAILGPVGVDQNGSPRQVALGRLSGGDQLRPGLIDLNRCGDIEPILVYRRYRILAQVWRADVSYFDMKSPQCPHTSPFKLPVCVYDWDGLSHLWHDPTNSLLHPDPALRAHLLVHLYWHYCILLVIGAVNVRVTGAASKGISGYVRGVITKLAFDSL
jgi:hypothetical protein